MWHEFRSSLSDLVRRVSLLRFGLWRSTRKIGRAWHAGGPGGVGKCRSNHDRRRVFLRPDPAFGGRSFTGNVSDLCFTPGQPFVANCGDQLPVAGDYRPFREIASSGNRQHQLCVPDGDLVVADHRATRTGHLRPPTASSFPHSELAGLLSSSGLIDAERCAFELVAEFGSLNEVLSAVPFSLERIVGLQGAAILAAVNRLFVEVIAEPMRFRPIASNSEAVTSLLRRLIGHSEAEVLIVLHLDGSQRLLGYDVVATGCAGSVEFDPRKIILHAAARGASGMIVAHNHPSGDPRPSHADLVASKKLARVAECLGITLHDHLVIAGNHVRSAMWDSK